MIAILVWKEAILQFQGGWAPHSAVAQRAMSPLRRCGGPSSGCFSGGSGRSFWGGHVVIPKSVKNHEEEYKTYNWRETCTGKPYFLNTKTHYDPFSSQNHATEWL